MFTSADRTPFDDFAVVFYCVFDTPGHDERIPRSDLSNRNTFLSRRLTTPIAIGCIMETRVSRSASKRLPLLFYARITSLAISKRPPKCYAYDIFFPAFSPFVKTAPVFDVPQQTRIRRRSLAPRPIHRSAIIVNDHC